MACWLPTQVAKGTGPGSWLGAAGTAYGRTSTVAVVSPRLGEAVARLLVCVSFATTSDDDVPLLVKTALELARYSVPPFAEANCVAGLTAGIAVNSCPSGAGATAFVLSVCSSVTGALNGEDARVAFGRAYRFTPS